MSVTFDFKIINSNVAGISQIIPQNEEAFEYMVAEAHLQTFTDGSAVLFDESVGDFISDAEWAHKCCEYV